MSQMIQGSAEWLEMRKNKIGASDAPIILGLSPWTTPYELWLDKMSLSLPKEQTYRMKRGVDLEPVAREKFTQMTGIKMKPDVRFHNTHSWMMASLDGIDENSECIVEIKCPNKEDHNKAINGSIPSKYYPQIQHQLAVCNLNMAYYFSFNGKDGAILEIYRDDSYIQNIINKETKFWECMQNFIVPEMQEKDHQQWKNNYFCLNNHQNKNMKIE